jgi:hypothetical protein
MVVSRETVAALLIPIGADTSTKGPYANLGYVGPMFDDGTFEYIPAKEREYSARGACCASLECCVVTLEAQATSLVARAL